MQETYYSFVILFEDIRINDNNGIRNISLEATFRNIELIGICNIHFLRDGK